MISAPVLQLALRRQAEDALRPTKFEPPPRPAPCSLLDRVGRSLVAGLLLPTSSVLPLYLAARAQPCHRTLPHPHALASRTVEATALHRPQEQAESSIKGSGKKTKKHFRTLASTLSWKLSSLNEHINLKLLKHVRHRQRIKP